MNGRTNNVVFRGHLAPEINSAAYSYKVCSCFRKSHDVYLSCTDVFASLDTTLNMGLFTGMKTLEWLKT